MTILIGSTLTKICFLQGVLVQRYHSSEISSKLCVTGDNLNPSLVLKSASPVRHPSIPTDITLSLSPSSFFAHPWFTNLSTTWNGIFMGEHQRRREDLRT